MKSHSEEQDQEQPEELACCIICQEFEPDHIASWLGNKWVHTECEQEAHRNRDPWQPKRSRYFEG
jgi:hypothetical protein